MQGRSIVITSGKGGVGKSTATANIGAALAILGKRVSIIDMDIGLRNLDVIMGLENRIIFTIVDAVKGKCQLKQAFIKDRRIKNLYLIAASQSDNKNIIMPDEMFTFINNLKSEFDFILIDCPAGIELGFENSIIAADEAIVICTPEISSIRDADRVIGILDSKSIHPKLIINRIIPKMVSRGDMMSHEDVIEILSIDLIGLIPLDEQVVISTNHGNPLILTKNSEAGEAFKRIALRINGKNDVPIVIPVEKRSFLEKIRRIFSGKNK